MRLLLPAFAALALAAPALTAPAAAQDWVMDEAASSVRFETTAFGGAATGDFSRFEAEITLDPEDLSGARIDARVFTDSIDTGNSNFQTAATGAEGLDPSAFPAARFVSDAIAATDDGYAAQGELTIRDVTRPLTLNFTLDITDGRAVADGAFEIARVDFGVGGAGWGDAAAELTILLHIEADAAP